jgi:hypothetical protein
MIGSESKCIGWRARMEGYDDRKVESLLRAHLLRYPLMQPEDVYKLLFQAVMGPVHALADPVSARLWLLSEMKASATGPKEPLIDPISCGGPMARVHLRPWLLADLDPDLLFDAFAKTPLSYHGSIRRLETACQEAAAWLRRRQAPIAEAFDLLIPTLREPGFPALRHSQGYRAAYRPAYRVVDVSLLNPEAIAAARH